MKTKLIVFLSLLTLLVMPKDVSALTYEVNGDTYTVSDLETFRDYCYFTYIYPDDAIYTNMDVKLDTSNNRSTCRLWSFPGGWYSDKVDVNSTDYYYLVTANWPASIFNVEVNSGFGSIYQTWGLQANVNNTISFGVYFNYSSNIFYYPPLKDVNGDLITEGNFTFQEIEEKYGIYPEEPEEPSTSIEFPIDKNEFYVLLVLLGTLIMMFFFKCCFPMFGGKNL